MFRYYYTVYRNKDDSVVAFGSAEECAKMLGFSNVSSFHSMLSRQRRNNLKKHTIVIQKTKMKQSVYIVEDKSGKVIARGTAKECIEKLGMSGKKEFYWALNRSRKGASLKKYGKVEDVVKAVGR